jgi:hypothetical protein
LNKELIAEKIILYFSSGVILRKKKLFLTVVRYQKHSVDHLASPVFFVILILQPLMSGYKKYHGQT